ncbi:hypothetical protein, partial [Mycoplasmopsis pullorum]
MTKCVAIAHILSKGDKFKLENGDVVDYDFFKSGRIIDYIARSSAAMVMDNDLTNDELNTLFLNSGKTHNEFFKSFLKKYNSNTKLSGVCDVLQGHDDIEIDQAKESLQNLSDKQKIFSVIISPQAQLTFDNNFFSKQEWVKVIGSELRQFLKNNYANPDKFKAYMSIHVNTNIPHAHLVFFETEPSITTKDNKQIYFYKKFFYRYSLNTLTSNITKAINQNVFDKFQNELLTSKDTLYDFKRTFRNDLNTSIKNIDNWELRKKMRSVVNYCINNKTTYYGKIDDPNVLNTLKEIKDELIQINPAFANLDQNYQTYLDSIKTIKTHDKNSERIIDDIYINEQQSKDSKIYNFIIKSCLKFDQDARYSSNPFVLYSSDSFLNKQLNIENHFLKSDLKDLNNFFEQQKVIAYEQLDIKFNNKQNMIDLENFDEHEFKEYKKHWAILSDKLNQNPAIEHKHLEQHFQFILNYWNKFNLEYIKFNDEYQQMIFQVNATLNLVKNPNQQLELIMFRDRLERDVEFKKRECILK